MAREVEGAVPGDIQLLRLLNEVWEPCTDAKQRSKRFRELSSTAPTTAPHCLTWAWLCQPVPSHKVLPICGRHGSLSGTSGPARLQLTFQLYQDGIRCNLNARDVEFADVGAVIRALSSTDATREKGEVVRAVMGRAHRTQIGGRWVEISISKPMANRWCVCKACL